MKKDTDQKVTVEGCTYMTPIQGSPDKVLDIKIENHINTSSCKEEIQLHTYLLNIIKLSNDCYMVENGYMTKWHKQWQFHEAEARLIQRWDSRK